MTNLKRVFLVMLIVFLLGATVVFATGDLVVITDPDENTSNTSAPTTIEPTPTNNVNTTNISNVNTTNTNNVTQNLPKTGENDHIYVLAIGLFAISAVYAYKKVIDYKNI